MSGKHDGGGRPENLERVCHDNFSAYAAGPFSEPYTAVGEVHYPPKTVDQGPWTEICTHYSFEEHGVRWAIEDVSGQRMLRQTGHNREHRRTWKYYVKKHVLRRGIPEVLFYPALALGSAAWKDLLIRTQLTQDSDEDFSGVLFGMEHGRRHFGFGLRKGRAVLFRRDEETVRVLATRRVRGGPGAQRSLDVLVEDGRVRAWADDECVASVAVRDYAGGKVGIAANVPTSFARFEVQMRPEERQRVEKEIASRRQEAAGVLSGYPPMRLQTKVGLPAPPSGRSLRFGDLTGDGRLDILIAQGTPLKPGDNYNSLTCLTAMDLDGRMLWQRGRPHSDTACLCSDLPVQIYDIDGDGAAEVICAMEFTLMILDGRTGEVRTTVPTPPSVAPMNAFPQVLGDSIQISNVRGLGRPRDILLKDRHSKIWAYDDKLAPLWSYHYAHGELAHVPVSADLNADGRDEVLVGSALLDSSGTPLWDLKLRDHADAIAVLPREDGEEPRVALAASDEGFLLCGLDGRVHQRLRLGHVQTVIVGKLIPDLPGYQYATNTYWGNPGIIYVLDHAGAVLSAFQPSVLGSPLVPVNWLGTGQALLLLSAASDETGGLYDGRGRQVVAFPDDGHPSLCSDAMDLDGDGLDELLCWDRHELWVYRVTPDRASSAVQPVCRHPAPHNESNYVARALLAV
jgi:rhamnogalacturonan endolyase